MNPVASITVLIASVTTAAPLALAEEQESVAPNSAVFRLFPDTAPTLSPYLAWINLYSTNCLKPGALLPSDPVSDAAQWTKSQLATIGLQYEIKQAFAFAGMSDVQQGQSTLWAYNAEIKGNWIVFSGADADGWLTYQLNAGSGLGAGSDETPKKNLDSQTEPGAAWLGYDIALKQLAWSTAILDGSVVVTAGMLNQGNFFDQNLYSDSRFAQLNNSSFVSSAVFSEPSNDLAVTFQWQPASWCYLMLGAGTNNAKRGSAPWLNVRADAMSYLMEFGLIGEDTFGWGPGLLRLAPFYATNGATEGAGFAVNFEQKLGKETPFGVFGRFGVADEGVASLGGASAQASLGLAAIGLFAGADGRGQRDYAGLAFGWVRSPDGDDDEYVTELSYTWWLTPTTSLQPNLQWVVDSRGAAPTTDPVVIQLSLIFEW